MEKFKVMTQLELMLEDEAKRIMGILIEMYNDKIKVNKNFTLLVSELIKKEFTLYENFILSKVTSYIPVDLMICPTSEYVFVTDEEYHYLITEEKTKKINTEIKDVSELIENITKKIIMNYHNDKLEEQNILEILYSYVPKEKINNIYCDLFSQIIYNIISDIDKDYKVISINPLKINGL